jgi:hypothetical protein
VTDRDEQGVKKCPPSARFVEPTALVRHPGCSHGRVSQPPVEPPPLSQIGDQFIKEHAGFICLSCGGWMLEKPGHLQEIIPMAHDRRIAPLTRRRSRGFRHLQAIGCLAPSGNARGNHAHRGRGRDLYDPRSRASPRRDDSTSARRPGCQAPRGAAAGASQSGGPAVVNSERTDQDLRSGVLYDPSGGRILTNTAPGARRPEDHNRACRHQPPR